MGKALDYGEDPVRYIYIYIPEKRTADNSSVGGSILQVSGPETTMLVATFCGSHL